MNLSEKLLKLHENIRYTVFKLDRTNNLTDRQELNNLGELNKYLSKANGNYIVVGIKENGKSLAKFIAMNKGEKQSESPVDKNQHSGIFKKLKEMGISEAKVEYDILISSEENDRPQELALVGTEISKNNGGDIVLSFKPNKTRDAWEEAMDEKSNWTCSGRVKLPSGEVIIVIGRFMANMDKIVVPKKELKAKEIKILVG